MSKSGNLSGIKLFCLPYAGGSASVYGKWKQLLSPSVELIPVELAGRGRRVKEAFYKDFSEAVKDAFRLIEPDICKGTYALFGHSMGSMIVYELAQEIQERGLPSPGHLFFSGGKAPHTTREDEKKYHLMSHDDFLEEVVKLGGTPREFFDEPALLDFFLPLLKNDFRITETKAPVHPIRPLKTGITVFLGKEDDLTMEQSECWDMHTLSGCSIHYFEGGHFFLHDKMSEIVQIINDTITAFPKSVEMAVQ